MQQVLIWLKLSSLFDKLFQHCLPKKPVYLAIYELCSRVTSQRSPNLNRFETSSSLNANKMFQNVFPYRRFSCFTITRLLFTCFNQARSCTWYSFIKDWIEHEFIDEPLGPDATTRGFDSITPRFKSCQNSLGISCKHSFWDSQLQSFTQRPDILQLGLYSMQLMQLFKSQISYLSQGDKGRLTE